MSLFTRDLKAFRARSPVAAALIESVVWTIVIVAIVAAGAQP